MERNCSSCFWNWSNVNNSNVNRDDKIKHCMQCNSYIKNAYTPKQTINPMLNIALLESTITDQYNPGYLSIEQITHVRMAFDYMMHILEEQKLITKKDCMKLCSLNNKLYYKSIKRIAEGVEKLYDRHES